MTYDMIGPALVLGFATLGSAIGCGIAGMASHGVMARVDENHGKFIGMSALPSSQAIYGFVLMILMKQAIIAKTQDKAWFLTGTLSLVLVNSGICLIVKASEIDSKN